MIEKTISISVKYNLKFGELDEFSKAIKKFGKRLAKEVSTPSHITQKKKKFRRDNILNVLLNNRELTSGELYNKVKKINQKTYKTFQRDIIELIIMGKIETKVRIGGKDGTTTKIKLKEN